MNELGRRGRYTHGASGLNNLALVGIRSGTVGHHEHFGLHRSPKYRAGQFEVFFVG
jgi:hypothetical protein